MKDIKEIELEISKITKEISNLQNVKKELELQLISMSDSFEKKFLTWMNSDMGEHYRWIPDKSEFPTLRPYIEEHLDLERYRTYNLLDLFEEEIYYLENPEKLENNQFFSEEDMITFKKVAGEMMEKNIISFTCDW